MMGARIHLDWNVIRSIAEMSKYEFEPGDILKLQKYESLVKEHDQKKKVGWFHGKERRKYYSLNERLGKWRI